MFHSSAYVQVQRESPALLRYAMLRGTILQIAADTLETHRKARMAPQIARRISWQALCLPRCAC